jgi:uncharacterized protein
MPVMSMILEGIVTSVDAAGNWNAAPMGPIVDPQFSRFTLRPFETSQTYRNLKQVPYGVVHVVDDVLLLARAAIGRLDTFPDFQPAERIPGRVLLAACRWYEFEVVSCDAATPRVTMQTQVLHSGRLRDFWGFNRAKHAVLEAAILATRVHLIPPAEMEAELARLKIIVDKTAGPDELAAFELLTDYVRQQSAGETSHV